MKLFFSIIVGFFIGMSLDKVFGLHVPVFTMIFSILGLVGGIWICLKQTK